MRHLVLALVVVLVAVVAAQDRPRPEPPSTSKTSPSNENGVVVMQGCVDGARFIVPMMTPEDLQQRITGSREYHLEGPSEMLAILRGDHDGHFEEITGILKVTPAPGEEQHIGSTQIGDKTRITIGRRESTTPALGRELPIIPDGNAPPVQIGTLRLVESKHLEARCPRW